MKKIDISRVILYVFFIALSIFVVESILQAIVYNSVHMRPEYFWSVSLPGCVLSAAGMIVLAVALTVKSYKDFIRTLQDGDSFFE